MGAVSEWTPYHTEPQRLGQKQTRETDSIKNKSFNRNRVRYTERQTMGKSIQKQQAKAKFNIPKTSHKQKNLTLGNHLTQRYKTNWHIQRGRQGLYTLKGEGRQFATGVTH